VRDYHAADQHELLNLAEARGRSGSKPWSPASDGELDPELVTDAVEGLLATRPALAKRQAAVDPSQGHTGGQAKPKPSWDNFLAP
jgi:hypothetical protein